MNRRLLTILLLAFVIAGVCAFVVYRVVNGRLSAARPAASNRVVAAAANIKLGAVITAKDLSTIEIVGTLPTGAILKPENVIGRGVIADIYQGEPVLESRLAPPGIGGGLAPTIPVGMRALAVKVDDVAGLAGFATPGTRVDVVISGTPPTSPTNSAQITAEGTFAETLLQNIQVLSAGPDIVKDPEGKAHPVQVVNLLVTPDQAETLSLASNQTKIQLVLRNPLDQKVDPVVGTALIKLYPELLLLPQVKAPKVEKVVHKQPPAPVFSVEVINGSKRSETKFGSPEVQK